MLQTPPTSTAVAIGDVLNHPLVGVLMTEDFCWRTAVGAWRERKPSRWHRARYSAWRAEGTALDEKRTRIRELAEEIHDATAR